ncbi:MAG TPA: DUF1302 family protein [Candidatus Dormibacteraeota bacterium]|nr:DUF1302 family protein [Candidatus Dormibacteraeota bacterium]
MSLRVSCTWVGSVLVGLLLAAPVHATLRYGPIELSGSVDSQTLMRSTEIDQWQFVQNRNTALIRLDYEWLQKGKLVERFDVPYVKRSKLYMLYRGVYDSFWDIGPGGRQTGVSVYDDLVGGPIVGNSIGSQRVPNAGGGTSSCDATTDPSCICPVGQNCSRSGLYARISRQGRDALKFENTLREAYVDLDFAEVPLSFRLGRQQVIWGESDQFRLMDIINPIDTTWHLQQEPWDKLRIPLWLVKGIWDMGDLGPISNAFTEVVWNPGDYQPGNKVEFLPAPWALPIPNPVRSGQILFPSPQNALLLSSVFNLQGTSFRQGDFARNPWEASDIGLRFHGITDIPLFHMQGLEFTANYLYSRGRGIGAVQGAPFGLKIKKIVVPANLVPANAIRQTSDPNSPPATFVGLPVYPAKVTAEFIHPYTHVFGMTANYFEGNYTNTVYRMEMAYQLGAPFQSAFVKDRPHVVDTNGEEQAQIFPLGFTKRDVWAGMLGFDRPTWIRFLNPRATWFITGQFFWSYVNGTWSKLRGSILTADELPYISPPRNSILGGRLKNGVGQWGNGQFAGQIERTQSFCDGEACGAFNMINGNGDKFLQWEMLTTLAATSFYAGGTIVPTVAIAIDPMNRNFLAQLSCDYFVTNDLIVQLRENFYNDLGSGRPSLDPWGAGGLNARRDETGLKITYQF